MRLLCDHRHNVFRLAWTNPSSPCMVSTHCKPVMFTSPKERKWRLSSWKMCPSFLWARVLRIIFLLVLEVLNAPCVLNLVYHFSTNLSISRTASSLFPIQFICLSFLNQVI